MSEADLRQFMHEMMVRADRIIARVAARMDSQAEAMDRQGRAMERQARAMDEMAGELRDMRAESGAQRQALLAILDRLQNGGASA